MRRNVGSLRTGITVAALGVAVLATTGGVAEADRIVSVARHAMNAETVGGVAVSRKPKPGALVPLNRKGLLPASVIPHTLGAGQTIYGVVGGADTSASGNPAALKDGKSSPKAGDTFGVVQTVGEDKVRIDAAHMGLIGGEDEAAECDGDFGHPSAPPGFLCVYLDVDGIANVYEGKDAAGTVISGEGNPVAEVVPIGNGANGFAFHWTAAAPGLSIANAVWAYTAPDAASKAAAGS